MNVEPGKEWIVAEEKVTKENQIIEASEIKQVSSASPEDIRYMKEAIRQAKKAAALGDVPIGCVIVYQDKIIGRGYNRRMADKTVLAHAEIIAMRKACKKMGDWRLEDCTMYVTLEPCPMCAGAIVQARIPRVVIGCMNPKAGCAGSVLDMLHEVGFNHQVQTDINVCQEECSGTLSRFFKDLRKKTGRVKGPEAVAGCRSGQSGIASCFRKRNWKIPASLDKTLLPGVY